jgi:hypothetical protein
MRLACEYLKKAEDLEKLARLSNDALLKASHLDQAKSYRLLAADVRRHVVDWQSEKDRVA